jgi:hypothetical protein
MNVGDRHFKAMDPNDGGQFSTVLDCPSCMRMGKAIVFLQARDRPVTVRVTDGFTVLLNSSLEVRCGVCGATVYAHRERAIPRDPSVYDEPGHWVDPQ